MYHITVERLKELLGELESMTPLPPVGTPDAREQHEEWMKKHTHIRDLVRKAEYAALLSVPPEVAEVLDAIYTRKHTLLNLPALKTEP
jgi:hypothetical protein